jgi:hypothetical protein
MVHWQLVPAGSLVTRALGESGWGEAVTRAGGERRGAGGREQRVAGAGTGAQMGESGGVRSRDAGRGEEGHEWVRSRCGVLIGSPPGKGHYGDAETARVSQRPERTRARGEQRARPGQVRGH